MTSSEITRRDFLARGSAVAAGFTVVPSKVLGGRRQAPSDTLGFAVVGAGGMGRENARELVLSERLVAVCDVDFGFVDNKIAELAERDWQPDPGEQRTPEEEERAEKNRAKDAALVTQYAGARKYTDYREMFADDPGIDAVVIATPDHTHAVIAAEAMRAGKHVYVQKPLTHTVEEARKLGELAESSGVVTQMGNQGHSSDDARLINEWVQAGVIGAVRQVHIWTDRPIWMSGLLRPAPMPEDFDPLSKDRSWWPGTVRDAISWGLWDDFSKPEQLHWDLFVGPVAHEVPWHPMYHPFHWRGWVDFGTGALGDMGAHLVDHPFWALDLGLPQTVEATSTPWGGDASDPVSFPVATKVHFTFARRGLMPPVEMHWYDGGLMPRRPEELPPEVELPRAGGVMFVGERGLLLHETYGRNPRLFPEGLTEEAVSVPESYPRVPDGNHEMNWAEACKGNGEAVCQFPYASRLTETMLLATVALRAGQGFRMEYDAENMRVTNHEKANEYLVREYRQGWAL